MLKLGFCQACDDNSINTIAKIAKSTWTECYTHIIGANQVDYMLSEFQSTNAIKSQIENDSYKYYLLCLRGSKLAHTEYIGYFAIKPQKDCIFLSKLYIEKNYRAKGLATHTLDFIIGYAQSRGFNRIWLTVNKQNKDAIEAYKKLNFKIFDRVKNEIGNGFYMDDYYMELKN